MDTNKCISCKKHLSAHERIETDEFRNTEIKNYCSVCFIRDVKKGFGHYEIGKCSICENDLVLQFDDDETINLAKEDFTVHFTCKTIKNVGDNTESNLLKEKYHDELILYTIQPN